MRRERIIGLTLAAALAISACATESAQQGSYQLTEFSITGASRLSQATEAIALTNVGQFPHTLVITDDTGHVVAATGLIPPGESTSLEIALEPGTYSFTCRIVAQDGEGNLIDHFESGMVATVEVGA